MYDTDLGRIPRDLRRLPQSLAAAEARGDKRSVTYLARRLDRAQRLAKRLRVTAPTSYAYSSALAEPDATTPPGLGDPPSSGPGGTNHEEMTSE